jgi:cytochrome c
VTGRLRLLRTYARAVIAASFGFVLFAASPVAAAAVHTAEQVEALVKRAADHIQAVGPERAYVDFTRPDGGFVDGDLYIFCNSSDGISLAHGGNPKLVGKNLSAVRDSEGKLTTIEMNRVGLAQGHGWVDYFWPNPDTGRIQHKNSYVLRIDDRTVCASGYYMPDPQ